MPDPVEARRKYEQVLKEQMEERKRLEEESRRKEQLEEEKLERRLKEQQEKMKQEFNEELRKREEEAVSILVDHLYLVELIDCQVLKEQEQRRQMELLKEIEEKKKEAAEKKHFEKKIAERPKSKDLHVDPPDLPQRQYFRSNSPPIPTIMRQLALPKEDCENTNEEDFVDNSEQEQGSESLEVMEQFHTMRQGLERRQESWREEDDWSLDQSEDYL